MNREELMAILPHREPMLLIDEATAVDETHCVGKYTVRGDEWFLQGHFPGNPVVPGVVLCEMMGQATAALLRDRASGGTPYFTGLDKVKFKHTVLPGDTLEIQCEIIRSRGPFYWSKGKGTVNGKLAVTGEFSFAIIKNKE